MYDSLCKDGSIDTVEKSIAPAVSILVPIYGVADYIERCAASLFAQTFDDIEYIFVDDCSPDDSVERLLRLLEKQYPHRKKAVKIIRNQTNQGVGKTRATAIEAATGDYLWFVDSDDYVAENAAELLHRTAMAEDADIVIFGLSRVFSEHAIYPERIQSMSKQDYFRQILEMKQRTYFVNKFFSRKFFQETGITFTPGINHGEDFSVVPRLIFHASHISFLDEILYYYIQYNSGAYTKSFREGMRPMRYMAELFFVS